MGWPTKTINRTKKTSHKKWLASKKLGDRKQQKFMETNMKMLFLQYLKIVEHNKHKWTKIRMEFRQSQSTVISPDEFEKALEKLIQKGKSPG